MRPLTTVTVHDTDPELYAQFARVFGERGRDEARWVTFTADDVQVIMFAPQPKPEAV